MTAAESKWEFPLADAAETARAPRSGGERGDARAYRPELFVYPTSGYVELRCAAGWLNSDTWRDLEEWR